MSADLDELFDQLGRRADALPLAGADHARQRGRHRTQVRATVSAAAAIVLVMAGIGVITLRQSARHAAPASVDRGPRVAPPIDLGGPVGHALTTTDGRQVYTTWIKNAEGSTWVTAADLGTGARAWAAQPIVDAQRTIDRIVVVPAAVLVITRADNGTHPELGLHAFDPVSGRPLWQMEAAADDSLVFVNRMLVHLDRRTGRTEGFDWATGASAWSVRPGHDRPVRAVGMGTTSDEERVNQAGPPATFTDDRFVQLTDAGTAEVRNVATGLLDRTVPVTSHLGGTAIARDGWLYSHDESDHAAGPQHIRATDLTGDGGSSVVLVTPDLFVNMSGCGPARLCVATKKDGRAAAPPTTLTAVDILSHRKLWQVKTLVSGDQISSAHGRTMLSGWDGGWALFDAAGRLAFGSDLVGGWLDPDTLYVVAPDGTGRQAKWSAPDKRLTPLGIPGVEINGNCASTGERIACPTPDGLVIWDVR